METIYPHPECMAPDGADPCTGYKAALDRIASLTQQVATEKAAAKRAIAESLRLTRRVEELEAAARNTVSAHQDGIRLDVPVRALAKVLALEPPTIPDTHSVMRDAGKRGVARKEDGEETVRYTAEDWAVLEEARQLLDELDEPPTQGSDSDDQ